MRWIYSSVIFLFLFLGLSAPVLAESKYVLPYPSFMPGSKFYFVKTSYDKAKSFWYFGDIAQFSYNLKQADKFLVEAKTLYEYKQYVLAKKSLDNSNDYFDHAGVIIGISEKRGRNIHEKKELLKEAAKKHIEILKQIKGTTPEEFVWTPEKEQATIFKIHTILHGAEQIREKYL